MKAILEILGKCDKCQITKLNNREGFEITYGCMYEAPVINFQTLMRISEMFGTESIDVDDYGHGGCDTCDYGSDYGHTIQIINPTKNIEEMKPFLNKELVAKK